MYAAILWQLGRMMNLLFTSDYRLMEIDTPYFVVLEDGNVVFIEITQEMRETIDNSYEGDEEAYFAEVVCEEYDISYNNCEWSITCESCIACYGKVPQITT